MGVITSCNVATAITKLVACDALPMLLGNVVMGHLVSRDFEPTIARMGDIVNVPDPMLGTSPIELTRHAEANFLVPDITRVLAVPDLLALYMQPAVATLAEQIETDLLALSSQFLATAPFGEPATPISEGIIEAAGTLLFLAKVAPSQPKYLVVDANTYWAMRRMRGFGEYRNAGDAGLRVLVDGRVGKINDFFVFRSRNVAKTGSDPASTHNLAFVRDAICMTIRRLPKPLPGSDVISEYAELGTFGMQVAMDYQPNRLAQQFVLAVLYGCAVRYPDHGVEITT